MSILAAMVFRDVNLLLSRITVLTTNGGGRLFLAASAISQTIIVAVRTGSSPIRWMAKPHVLPHKVLQSLRFLAQASLTSVCAISSI